MENKRPGISWGVEQRLEYIEFRLFWEGGINRSDITEFFGVSVPQASKDLSQYQELAPTNIVYDKSLKRYLASERFAPMFMRPDASRYLNQLRSLGENVTSLEETWLANVPSFETLPIPHRTVDPALLRKLLQAIRNKRSIEAHYQSLSRPDSLWRRITPHALAFDGNRWHARAFCHIDRTFKDFLLPRFFEVRDEGDAGATANDDLTWREIATVRLKPHPGLTVSQRRAVALDFGMDGDSVSVRVRLALLYYFLRRLGLDFKEEERSAREQHLVLANADEVRAALQRAQSQPTQTIN